MRAIAQPERDGERPLNHLGSEWHQARGILAHAGGTAPTHAALQSVATLLASMSEGFVTLDGDWRYTYVNPRAAEMLGREAQSLIGRVVWQEFPEAVGSEFQEACQSAMRSQMPVRIEDYYAPWDKWYEHRIHPASNGLAIFFQEITDRKRAEEARAHAAATLQSMIDSLPAYVAVIDATQRYEFVNGRYETWFGLPRQEIVGKHLSEMHPAHAYAEMRGYVERSLKGESVRYDRPLDDLYGEQHWFEVRYAPRWEADGSVSGCVAVVFDVTERKRTEEALRENEQRLRIALRAPNVAVFTQDADLRYTWMYQPQLGYTTDEVIGKTDADLLPPATARRVAEIKGRVLATGNSAREEIGMAVGGSTLWFDLVIDAMRDAGGAITGLAGASLDITDIVRTREDLARLNEELEDRVAQRTAEMESFSYSVSHDLRAPLRAINGFSRLLQEDYAEHLDALGQEYLGRICKASSRMGQLIDDLLALTQLSRRELHRGTVNLSALADEIAYELKQAAPGRRIEFEIAPDLDGRGDAGLLRVVLDNLLHNACKYARPKPIAKVSVGRTEHGGRRAIFVRDNGVGFDMAYAAKLFRPFQRLHPESQFEGSGIGLATVHRIVRRHGGEVWAEGRVGEGATFYFSLPD
jgi:PAS domain S-box-containing protein